MTAAGARWQSRALRSPLGPIAVFVSDGAVVRIRFCDAPNSGDDPLLDDAVRQLTRYFANETTEFDLPLAPAGSGLQKQVWRRLTAIPYGETITYGALAEAVGGGPRAVANMCGRNPIPIVIPCHRVVGAGDWLGGFSGGAGVATKEDLLRLEGALPHTLFSRDAFDRFAGKSA